MHTINYFSPSEVNHLSEIDFVEKNEFKNFDDALDALRKLGTTYYTLSEVNNEDVFLFYVPSLSKSKYIIKENKLTV